MQTIPTEELKSLENFLTSTELEYLLVGYYTNQLSGKTLKSYIIENYPYGNAGWIDKEDMAWWMDEQKVEKNSFRYPNYLSSNSFLVALFDVDAEYLQESEYYEVFAELVEQQYNKIIRKISSTRR